MRKAKIINNENIILSTTEIKNKDVEVIELISGNTVLSRGLVFVFLEFFRAVIGLRLRAFEKMYIKSKTLSTNKMIKKANDLNADAIIGIKISTSKIADNYCEVTIFGTAVKFK